MITRVSRRDALLAAAGLGVGAAVSRLPGATAHGATHQDRVRGLHAALNPAQRAQIFLPWEHPSRQLVNTVAILERPHIGTLLNANQMAYVWALWGSMLSAEGSARYREPLRAEGGGLDGCTLVVYGDPHSGPCQSVISGGHLQVRGGDIPSGGFGDGVSYGHQVGNHQLRVPGNVWAFHSDAANILFAALTADQRTQAVLKTPPHELTLQVQDDRGRFTGLSGASMNEVQREHFGALLGAVLSAYPEPRARAALADIESNGGLSALHISYYAGYAYYADGTRATDVVREGELPYYQVWRVEGPGAVLHFQGYPHVHAYIRITRDPHRQHVGQALARSESLLGEVELKRFMERALRRLTSADLVVYPDAVPARFPPGVVSEGLVWSLDPFGNMVEVVSIRGDQMSEPWRRKLGVNEPRRLYRVASMDYYLNTFAADLGNWDRRESTGLLLRDALVTALRQEPTLLSG